MISTVPLPASVAFADGGGGGAAATTSAVLLVPAAAAGCFGTDSARAAGPHFPLLRLLDLLPPLLPLALLPRPRRFADRLRLRRRTRRRSPSRSRDLRRRAGLRSRDRRRPSGEGRRLRSRDRDRDRRLLGPITPQGQAERPPLAAGAWRRRVGAARPGGPPLRRPRQCAPLAQAGGGIAAAGTLRGDHVPGTHLMALLALEMVFRPIFDCPQNRKNNLLNLCSEMSIRLWGPDEFWGGAPRSDPNRHAVLGTGDPRGVVQFLARARPIGRSPSRPHGHFGPESAQNQP